MYLISVLKHCAWQSSYSQPNKLYISVIGNHTLSIEQIKTPEIKKNWAGMSNTSIKTQSGDG